jgi:hypothetical protein
VTELDERIRHELERLRPSVDGLEPTLRLVERRRRTRRIMGGVVGVTLTLGLVAGLFALPGRGPAPTATTSGSTAVSPTTAPSGPATSPTGPAAGAGFVATCAVSVDVDGPLPSDWQQTSVTVGPLTFFGIRIAASEPPSDFAGGGLWVAKALVVVAPGHEATVSVPASDAGGEALLYDPSQFAATGGYTLADGEQTVTFQACPPDGSTQPPPGSPAGTEFAGGFLAPGPTCVSLDVQADGGPATRVQLPIGKGTCG